MFLCPLCFVAYGCIAFGSKWRLYLRYRFSHSEPSVSFFYVPKEARDNLRVELFYTKGTTPAESEKGALSTPSLQSPASRRIASHSPASLSPPSQDSDKLDSQSPLQMTTSSPQGPSSPSDKNDHALAGARDSITTNEPRPNTPKARDFALVMHVMHYV